MLNAAFQTIGEIIERHAAEFSEQPALVCQGFAPFSFQQLNLAIKEVGWQLRDAGVCASSRVAIALPDGPEAVLLAVSIAAHAVVVPVHPKLTPAELEEELKSAEIDAIVVPGWIERSARAAARGIPIGTFLASKAIDSLSNIALQPSSPFPALRPNPKPALPNGTAVLFRSTGTSGSPTLVPVTHSNLVATTHNMRRRFGLSADDRCGCVLPVRHVEGFRSAILTSLVLGGSVAIPAARDIEDLATWISDLHPTWLFANPAFLTAALDRLKSRGAANLSQRLRFIVSEGGRLSEATRDEIEAIIQIPILESYSNCKAGIVVSNLAQPSLRKSGTVGLVPAGELAITGPNQVILAIGEIGKVSLRNQSPQIVCPDTGSQNSEGLQRGWLETDDTGLIDADGFLIITRKSDKWIIRGVETIILADVERALLKHPSIKEAIAFPISHPRLGEDVAAAVILWPDKTATSAEIRDFLIGRLAQFKLPERIFIVTHFPKDSTGQVSRSALSDVVPSHGETIANFDEPLELLIWKIWQRKLGRSDIGLDDNFFEIGGDSLLATTMLLEVEAITRRSIPQSALRNAYTIRQLNIAITQATPSYSETVTCARQGSGTPFFYCHGDFNGRGFYALKLADLVGLDEPIYLLHPSTNLERSVPYKIEELAQTYLPQMLAIYPNGRFRLGGWCNGGLFAWELARQLGKAGREVELVVLIDTLSINARIIPRFIARFVRLSELFIPKAVGDRIRLLGMSFAWYQLERFNTRTDQGVVARIIAKIRRNVSKEARPRNDQNRDLFRSYSRMIANYVPPKIQAEVLCLVCEEARHQYNRSPLPWKRWASSVRYEYLPGGHLSCITLHLDHLSDLLRQQFLEKRE